LTGETQILTFEDQVSSPYIGLIAVVVSRQNSTIRRRNAIGAHGGSYSIYHALAIATKQLPPTFTPNYAFTHPPVTIGPFPQWSEPGKIVSMDPWGHLTASIFESVRPRLWRVVND
jgi:hypothetical protein